MGLFKKFRSDEKPSRPLAKLPAKSSLNLESSGDASEFSLATSQLSHSSQDTNKRHLELLPRKAAVAAAQLNRHLLQPRISPSALGMIQHLNGPNLHQNYHSSAQQQPVAQNGAPNGGLVHAHSLNAIAANYHHHQGSNSALAPRGRASLPPAQASSATVPSSPAAGNRPVRVSHSASTSMLSTVPMPFYPTNADDSYTLASTLAETSLGLDDEAKHPYYDQWKQYYAAMAGYKGPPARHTQYAPHSALLLRRASFAGYANSPYAGANGLMGLLSNSNSNSHSNIANANSGNYMHYVASQDTRRVEPNGLVRNSRMSTLKLNRSSLAPSLAQGQDPRIKSRAVSMNVVAPNETAEVEDDEIVDDPPVPSALGAPSTKLVSFGLLGMGLERPPPVNTNSHSSVTDSTASDMLGEPDPNGPLVREDSAISDYGKYLFNSTFDDLTDQADETEQQNMDYVEPGVHAAIMAANEAPAHHSESVSRNDSTTSKSSYNSLQSELNFSVGRKPTRIAPQTEQQRNLSRRQKADRRFSRQSQFVPPMPGPPPPMFGQPGMPPSPSSLTFGSQMLPYGSSSDNIPPEGAAFQLQQMQQQIQQLQQLQQQQMHMNAYQGNPRHSRTSVSPQPQPRSLDSTINAKIEEFVHLRLTIAAGHKTFDFRLRWAKMLITAVNYKLYAYVNIKGDNIPSEQAAMNKLTFVKLAVTHLQKMLKELDVEKHTPQDRRIFAEVCYIHGCLLMHDYVTKFEQDFNIQQDKDEADRFFRKCLELNPLFFRAHYRLAELFEEDQTEESFDTALYHYTQAAKLGYNRAIYQVALIYLTVPKARLLKYYKYLKSLSDIDMDSKDIKLSPEDRDELEEVSGLASFQLAKIYEGIYPGDLTQEDEFVQKSLEIAPVNYAKGLSYYNRAARLHCLQAQVRLGHIYENGDLNRKYNPNKSIQWFIKAATSPLKFKRHPEAMLGLSRWFMIGTNGLSKHIPYPDPQGALMWAERACKEFSFPEAFYAMGQFAEQGLAQGDPQEWYMESYNLGFAEAATKLPGYQPPPDVTEQPEMEHVPDANGAEDLTYTEGVPDGQGMPMAQGTIPEEYAQQAIPEEYAQQAIPEEYPQQA